MSSTTDTDKSEIESLDDFLTSPHAQEFLDREGIDPLEVHWFAKHHIGEERRREYTAEEVGVVAVMYLTGMCLKTQWEGPRDIRRIDGCARILSVLGYDARGGPGKWYELHNKLREEESFSKQMLSQVERIHGLIRRDVQQRLILAYAEVKWQETLGYDVDNTELTRIAERHDTTPDQVMGFKETFEEEHDQ